MSIFDIFQNPEDLGKLPKDPLGFVSALVKRKHWREIRPSILLEIAREAGDDREGLLIFAYISEKFGLVEHNYVRTSNSSDDDLSARVSFGCTLCFLGVRELQVFHQMDESEEKRDVSQAVDMAFSASLVCDPLQISSYAYLANLYALYPSRREVALEFCAKYRAGVDKLMNSPMESLSGFHQVMRTDLESPDLLKRFADKWSSSGSRGHSSADLKRFVHELDHALRKLDPQNLRDDDSNAVISAVKKML